MYIAYKTWRKWNGTTMVIWQPEVELRNRQKCRNIFLLFSSLFSLVGECAYFFSLFFVFFHIIFN